jgi:phosphoribosylformylglycinamidine cyclo-ligase
MARKRITYKGAGVDIAAGDRLVRRIRGVALKTARPGLLAGVGGFSGLFDIKTLKYRHPVLVSSTDGVGTKLKIAFMTGVHDTIGVDLVAMGVNDVLTQGAEPIFFLDYFVSGKLDVGVAEKVIRGIADGCMQAGCVLIGGETAEHPGDFPGGEYDLAGFAVGVAERDELPDPKTVAPGDALIGLASSGLHSNGYSLARKVLLEVEGLRLEDRIAELGCTLGEEMLKPTRIYVKLVRALRRDYRIKAMAHITGGGIPGNLPRVLPEGRRAYIRRKSWTVPPIFDLIRRFGRVSQPELDRTFNNGIGMILVVAKDDAAGVEAALKKMGEPYAIMGEIRKGARGAQIVP